MSETIKALIVDDNSTNIAVMQATLEALSVTCDPDIAEDGRAALGLLRRVRYDLVLLDYHMPELSGAEVLQWINAHMARRPYVVMVTADNRGETMRLAETLGCDGYLAKPVMLDDLRAVLSPVVDAHLGGHRRAAARA